jgi:soluble lytic murein transglycosylase-like protein
MNAGMRMKRHLLLYALAAFAFGAAPARADTSAISCAQAGAAAEQAGALPANMLVSIGMVESGRADPLTGRVTPWPWTVNVDGAGHYFASKQDAIAFTRLAESSGAGDIDVGCFQISLEYHPDAFNSLDAAFDPAANAAYAAGFLNQLKSETGSWNTAIADYHSAVPDLGLPYQRRVLAAWHGLGSLPPDLGNISAAVDADAVDPVVILQGPKAHLVRVITMDDPPSTGLRSGLPRVISP